MEKSIPVQEPLPALTEKTNTETSLRELPYDAPIVSMETGLGSRLREKYGRDIEIDFDYQKFYEAKKDMGAEAINSSDLKITLGYGNKNDYAGEYFPAEREIHVYDQTLQAGAENATSTAIHELQHDIDYQNQEPFYNNKLRDKIYRAGKFAAQPRVRKTSDAALGAGVAATYGSLFSETLQNHQELIVQGSVVAGVGAAAVMGTAFAGYHMERGERRARKAQKEHKQQLIKIDPLP